jgi:hypothetical protein
MMFFADPVAAFANFAGATRESGRLAFVCWQPRDANVWFDEPARPAAAHVELTSEGVRAPVAAWRVCAGR